MRCNALRCCNAAAANAFRYRADLRWVVRVTGAAAANGGGGWVRVRWCDDDDELMGNEE